ncbi:hypothetical protein [Rubrivivax albus]|uniref:Uncharacterized protein n=1 Tax=Rubrivivax albus TaxID=2499835 RepID=A0A3S2U8R7_9BURK|nr:hypothetical protein [Rubrivivax albus]RVT51426.1 hypothetical protein ENE75_11400 [Rubrivivax albus]
MDPLERVMRVMTHVNIGAALGLVVWLAWSGAQVVTGQIAPARLAPPASVSPVDMAPVVAPVCRCERRWQA